MESRHYWSRMRNGRVSRRSMLRSAGLAGAGLAGAALIGCGDEEDGEPDATATGAAGTGTAAVNDAPKRGGTLRMALDSDPPGWNVFTATGAVASINAYSYDKVIGLKTGPDVVQDSAEVEPVLASALPEQPDDLTYVFKLRQGIKFQNVDPLNGREMTVEDVQYSLDQLRAHNTYKNDYAPIVEVSTPDEETVIVKTDTPYAPLLPYLGVGNYGTWKVFPQEIIDSGLTDTISIGTGPYMRAQWEQGNRIVFARNPDYWDDSIAFPDEIHLLVIPDDNSKAAAFATDQIDILPPGAGCVQVEEYNGQFGDTAYSQVVGRNPSGQGFDTSKPPFNDIRVRQAMMLAYNRDEEAVALYCGPEKTQIATLMSLRDSVNPMDVPELAQNMRYAPEESKKLLAAAGYADGFTTDIHWTPAYNHSETLERYVGDAKAIGVTLNPISHEYAQWIAEVFRPPFNFEGMLWSSSRYYGDPDPYVTYWLHPNGISNHSRVNDPELTELIEQQRTMLNWDERLEVLHDIQRREGENAWYMWMSFGPNAVFVKNRVKGYGYHLAYEHTEFRHVWLEDA